MAAGGQSPFKDLIECPVCMEEMGPNKKPKLLPCQHTLCEHCVDRLHMWLCPICREPFSANSSKKLPTNLSILQLIDFTENMYTSTIRNMCEFCIDESHIISHFCKYCDEYFCSDCAKEHTEMCPKEAMPQCIDNSICLVHHRAFTTFCMDCNILLCMVCAQNKTCCSNNNKKPIENITMEKTQDLSRMITQISSLIQVINDNSLHSDTSLTSRMKTIMEIKLDIERQTTKLRDKLNQREKELMDEISGYETEIRKLQKLASAELGLDTLTMLKQTAETALVGGIVPILQTLPNIHAVIPQIDTTKTEIIIPDQITFKPQESMTIGNLHKSSSKRMCQGGRYDNSIFSYVFQELFYFIFILVFLAIIRLHFSFGMLVLYIL